MSEKPNKKNDDSKPEKDVESKKEKLAKDTAETLKKDKVSSTKKNVAEEKKKAKTSRRRQEAEVAAVAEEEQRRTRLTMLIFGVLLLVVVVGAAAWMMNRDTSEPVSEDVEQLTPPNAYGDNLGILAAQGNEGAPVVEMFFDYQCSHCGVAEAEFGPALDELAEAGEITLVYRAMMFIAEGSRRSAIAAACADQVGAYQPFHNAVLLNQQNPDAIVEDGFSDGFLREVLPTEVGIDGEDLTEFQTCYDGQATRTFTETVAENASRDGVTGTPFMRVNGEDFMFHDLEPTADVLLEAINEVASGE